MNNNRNKVELNKELDKLHDPEAKVIIDKCPIYRNKVKRK